MMAPLQIVWRRIPWGKVIALAVLGGAFPQIGSAQVLDRTVLEGREAPAPKHPKISGPLRQADAAYRQGQPVADATQVSVNADGIQVYIYLNDYEETHVGELTQMGVRIEMIEPSLKVIQARVPAGRLEAIAQLPFVRFVQEPNRPYSNVGSKLSQADGILGANVVRSTLGVNGSGVRIGVIQLGFLGIADSQASGDLPGGITTFTTRSDANFPGVGGEGTAMLELIHDLAPGAQLFGVSFSTDLEMIAAVNWLADVAGGPNPRRGTPGGVDIIVDDISFFNLGPYDGSSALSRAITAAVDRGVLYYTSAGNYAERHWRGFYGSCPGSNFHNFNTPSCGTGVADEVLDIQVQGNGTFCAHVQWNDAWSASGNDYDARLFDRDADKFLAASDGVSGGRNAQSGTQDPRETMCFTDKSGSTRKLGIVIENFEGKAQPRQIELFLVSDVVLLQHRVSDHSLPNVGDAKKAFSVGAVNWETPDQIESYSSRGPTLDGRLKPEVVAPDCVSVTGNGGFPSTFCGTSAAAPHAGAVAALVLSANPSLIPTQLYAMMVAPTFDLGTPFPNNTFGFGRLDAFASTQLGVNQPTLGLSVQPGGSGQLNWTVSFTYPNPPAGAPTLFADAYFGYLRPDGVLTFLGPGLGQSAGDLNNPQSFISFLSGVEADPGASLPPTQAFSTPISGPPGQYVAFFGAMPTEAGPSGNLWSLGSNSSNGGFAFQGVAIAPFSRP
ncbi:MAG: S8 family serine peptidase [Candidatus Methylomirabilis oxyfera]|nr:S8 family serine peptidase [Candidatus Methylomirabilis oxyfera]